MRLGSDKRFRLWAAPVDASTDDGAAYLKRVGFPMELATLLERINQRQVTRHHEIFIRRRGLHPSPLTFTPHH